MYRIYAIVISVLSAYIMWEMTNSGINMKTAKKQEKKNIHLKKKTQDEECTLLDIKTLETIIGGRRCGAS